MDLGKEGSWTPVMGFFSCMGALAANSGLGRSSSSWKSRQSQWWAREALLRFQYSRNVTAGKRRVKKKLKEIWRGHLYAAGKKVQNKRNIEKK